MLVKEVFFIRFLSVCVYIYVFMQELVSVICNRKFYYVEVLRVSHHPVDQSVKIVPFTSNVYVEGRSLLRVSATDPVLVSVE